MNKKWQAGKKEGRKEERGRKIKRKVEKKEYNKNMIALWNRDVFFILQVVKIIRGVGRMMTLLPCKNHSLSFQNCKKLPVSPFCIVIRRRQYQRKHCI